MNTKKQAQAYLNNLSFQGKTQTGQTQQLETQVIDQNKKNSEEFLLIKHKPEGGVEIKGQFTNEKNQQKKKKCSFFLVKPVMRLLLELMNQNLKKLRHWNKK